MSNLFGLPDVHFAAKDAAEIKRGIITAFEANFFEATGENLTLYPSDPRQLFLSTITDVIALQRNLIDWVGKENLLAFASEGRLDHLGIWLGVTRLPATRAKTTIRFALSAVTQTTTVIPAGIRVTTGDGKIYFATAETLEIPAGESFGDIGVEATESGIYANGLSIGQINRLVDPLPYIQSVTNITVSEGGADIEDDENLRERIQLAPESFSNAGSRGAYIYWARSASQLIVDVSVNTPEPGVVNIYPLLENGGIPGQEMLDRVLEVCNDDSIRPLTDHVFVLQPEPVSFDLDVTWYLDRSNATSASVISVAVDKAVREWIVWQKSALGRYINPSELTRRMVNAGAKRASITSPAFATLEFNEISVAETVTVIYGVMEDG